MHILAISSTVSQGLKARIETLLPIAALVLIGLLPRTGQAMPIELGGSGLKVNVATNESPAPYKLSSFIERKALLRTHGYARTVWLPSATSTQWGGQQVSFGLARLNPVFRRALGDSDGSNGASVVPIMWVPVSHNASMTLIPNPGGSIKAMVALQLQLGR